MLTQVHAFRSNSQNSRGSLVFCVLSHIVPSKNSIDYVEVAQHKLSKDSSNIFPYEDFRIDSYYNLAQVFMVSN
jgi:hypothetical protein